MVMGERPPAFIHINDRAHTFQVLYETPSVATARGLALDSNFRRKIDKSKHHEIL